MRLLLIMNVFLAVNSLRKSYAQEPATKSEDLCNTSEPKCNLVLPWSTDSPMDLSPLISNSPFQFSDFSNNKIVISICRALPSAFCGEQSTTAGACVTMKNNVNVTILAGMSSSDITWNQGKLGIFFDRLPGSNMTTEIIFICNHFETTIGKYKMTSNFLAETIHITWYTNATCLSPTPWMIYKQDAFFNLSSPMEASRLTFLPVPVTNETFIFGLFQAIPPWDGCEDGALACLQLATGGVGRQAGLTLGRVQRGLRVLENNSLEILYVDGDLCPACPELRLSTRILFVCTIGENDPMLTGMSNNSCEMNVEWHTRYACPIQYSSLLNANAVGNDEQTVLNNFTNFTNVHMNPRMIPFENIGINSSRTSFNVQTTRGGNANVSQCPPADFKSTCMKAMIASTISSFFLGALLASCIVFIWYCATKQSPCDVNNRRDRQACTGKPSRRRTSKNCRSSSLSSRSGRSASLGSLSNLSSSFRMQECDVNIEMGLPRGKYECSRAEARAMRLARSSAWNSMPWRRSSDSAKC
ncbi:cation-independent mannose-6-phosphate receptor [Hyalella azteca]|uniref:Cation-independent mannose-6-phosphate receptor n=1 Tax=Hyalella azteca TaxID=294128 RepID=A0A8B7PED9_HYAAZ|nr:cation-independent mannose-6-phosphate receptor [Hyalella azteca]